MGTAVAVALFDRGCEIYLKILELEQDPLFLFLFLNFKRGEILFLSLSS